MRLVTAEILLEANFRVIEAARADEALRVLEAGVAVDVLISDVEMPPGMNGYELARHVHGLWPLVEIMISSGREWPRETDLPPGATFLGKPYANATLVSHAQAAARRAQEARHRLQQHRDAGRPAEKTPTEIVPKRA